MSDIDLSTGLPIDKGYLECDLPKLLQESVDKMKEVWQALDNGESYPLWDCFYCDLQSTINICVTSNLITCEQAWYLREKYLRIERNSSI